MTESVDREHRLGKAQEQYDVLFEDHYLWDILDRLALAAVLMAEKTMDLKEREKLLAKAARLSKASLLEGELETQGQK